MILSGWMEDNKPLKKKRQLSFLFQGLRPEGTDVLLFP